MKSLDHLHTLNEKEWDAFLYGAKDGVATTLGWTTYHTLRSKGSPAGFPDRTCWRERLLFVELKTMAKDSVLKPRQIEFLTGMARAGAEVYVWRPSDYDEATRVLGMRGTFNPLDGSVRTATAELRPRSLWLPSGHRRDDETQLQLSAA